MFSGQSIDVIKKQLKLLSQEELRIAEDALKSDARIGVRKLGSSLERQRLKREEGLKRILGMKRREEELKAQGHLFVAGIDEAGRGPLAGPVVAACVVMREDSLIIEVDDSKKIKEDVRENLFDRVIADSISFGIGVAGNEEIDEINILQATFLAMKRAMQYLDPPADYLLIDGNQTLPEMTIRQEAIVQGDSSCYSIACASILAKVYRDRLMREYDRIYPEFQFAKNKGYGTAEHYEALKKWGFTPIHRRTFLRDR
ncbi:MAG: ribonuclease HII [Filifactor alocis]|nr:ribonuclease HII [Filifactor alocis]